MGSCSCYTDISPYIKYSSGSTTFYAVVQFVEDLGLINRQNDICCMDESDFVTNFVLFNTPCQLNPIKS